MESSSPNRVKGDSRSRLNSSASVDRGQASYGPSIHEQGQAIGGAVDIFQQIAQALQRVEHPIQVVPQRAIIERMAKHQPMEFLGKKDDEPSTTENWIERTKRMSHPRTLPKWMKGVRNYTGTLYLLFQTLVIPRLITESKYYIQRYKIELPP